MSALFKERAKVERIMEARVYSQLYLSSFSVKQGQREYLRRASMVDAR